MVEIRSEHCSVRPNFVVPGSFEPGRMQARAAGRGATVADPATVTMWSRGAVVALFVGSPQPSV
jgi:hypothetical protein